MGKIVYGFRKERMDIQMKTINSAQCNKYRKLISPNVLYIFNKTLGLFLL